MIKNLKETQPALYAVFVEACVEDQFQEINDECSALTVELNRLKRLDISSFTDALDYITHFEKITAITCKLHQLEMRAKEITEYRLVKLKAFKEILYANLFTAKDAQFKNKHKMLLIQLSCIAIYALFMFVGYFYLLFQTTLFPILATIVCVLLFFIFTNRKSDSAVDDINAQLELLQVEIKKSTEMCEKIQWDLALLAENPHA